MWQWHDQYGWVDYERSHCSIIEDAFVNGLGGVDLSITGDNSHRVDFNIGEQISRVTGFHRQIRRLPSEVQILACRFRWIVRLDYSWEVFDTISNQIVEDALAVNRTRVVLHLASGTYAVDMVQLKQRNLATNTTRDIARVSQEVTVSGKGSEFARLNLKPVENLLHQEDAGICAICQGGFDDESPAFRLGQCQAGHYFHEDCAEEMSKHAHKCPICGAPFDGDYGVQPEGGKMFTIFIPAPYMEIPGFPMEGAIVIIYFFQNGQQQHFHPHPGRVYTGTLRLAYLPNSLQGRYVARLLQQAFYRRLIFKVGDSLTTGETDTIVWSGIVHKTNLRGGRDSYGYPDPDYLQDTVEALLRLGIH